MINTGSKSIIQFEHTDKYKSVHSNQVCSTLKCSYAKSRRQAPTTPLGIFSCLTYATETKHLIRVQYTFQWERSMHDHNDHREGHKKKWKGQNKRSDDRKQTELTSPRKIKKSILSWRPPNTWVSKMPF